MKSSENNSVFVWKAFVEWKPALEAMFGDILTTEIEAKARQNATHIESGEMGYRELLGQPTEPIITNNKIDEFRRRYSHMRAYHGCRSDDTSNYYKKGLLLRYKDTQIERFRSIFLSGDFPELTEKMLQQSIREAAPYSDDDGELCLAIDDRFIVEHCGLYLIYGSEYLASLVIGLPIENTQKYLSVLRKIGKPTFFEINLPNTTEFRVTDCCLLELIHEMIAEWVRKACHLEAESCFLDFTFSLHQPLPPEHICSHYHPGKIPDPNMNRKIYDSETGEYTEIAQ